MLPCLLQLICGLRLHLSSFRVITMIFGCGLLCTGLLMVPRESEGNEISGVGIESIKLEESSSSFDQLPRFAGPLTVEKRDANGFGAEEVFVSSSSTHIVNALHGLLNASDIKEPDELTRVLPEFERLLARIDDADVLTVVESLGPRVFDDWETPRDVSDLFSRWFARHDPRGAVGFILSTATDDSTLPGLEVALSELVKRGGFDALIADLSGLSSHSLLPLTEERREPGSARH